MILCNNGEKDYQNAYVVSGTIWQIVSLQKASKKLKYKNAHILAFTDSSAKRESNSKQLSFRVPM